MDSLGRVNHRVLFSKTAGIVVSWKEKYNIQLEY